MDHSIPLFTSNTIGIYSTGWNTIYGNAVKSDIDKHSIVTIGDFVSFHRDISTSIVAHRYNPWPSLPIIVDNNRSMLEYDNILYSYDCLEGSSWILTTNSIMGTQSLIRNNFSNIVRDDLRLIIIRYLKKTGREYDPSLMKYPQKVYPEVPKVVPLDHTIKGFIDIIMRCIN